MQAALRAVRGPLAVQRISGDPWIAADKAQGGDMGDDGPPEMMASLELCRQSSHTAHRGPSCGDVVQSPSTAPWSIRQARLRPPAQNRRKSASNPIPALKE